MPSPVEVDRIVIEDLIDSSSVGTNDVDEWSSTDNESHMVSSPNQSASEVVEENQVAAVVARLRALLQRGLWDLVLSQKRNLQNLSTLVFVNFLIAGVGFVTQIKIANTLGRDGFGLLAYGLAIATYGGVVIRFGLDRTLVRDLVHFPNRFGELVAASLLLRWILFAAVVVMLVAWKFASGTGSEISWGLLLVIIANSMMSMDLQPVYDSWRAMSRHAVYNLIQRCLYFAVIWTVIVTAPKRLSVLSIGAATAGSVIFYLILQHTWAMARMTLPATRRAIFGAAMQMARGNLTIWLATLGTLSFGSLNQLMLKHYRGIVELGGYAAAWQMVSLAMMLLSQVARVGNPMTAWVTRDGVQRIERNRFLVKYTSVMVLTALPVALASICFPRLIMKTLFRPEYTSAAGALRIMGVFMLVYSVGLVASQFVVSTRLEKTYLASIVVGGVLGVTSCILLIPSLGADGAAIALVVSTSAAIALCWVAISLRSIERGTCAQQ
jgi:O-antigen/teichoic acid export membrane protein